MRDLKIYVAVGFALFAVYIIFQLNRPRPTDWTPTYSKTDKIPYGTYILYNRIKDILPEVDIQVKRKSLYNTFREEKINDGNYLIIAGSVSLDKYDFQELVKYMRKGNRVFIATYYLGPHLKRILKTTINSEKRTSEQVNLDFTNPRLKSRGGYHLKNNIGEQYFSSLDTNRVIVLAKNNRGNATFIKYRFRKGSLYLMPSPQIFTNYNLLDSAGSEYATKSLSYLHRRGDLIWDERWSLGPGTPESLFYVLLGHTQLRWAYFIALFSLLTFVIFEFKRRQRVIPIIPVLQNTSTEFARLVGQLYYEKRDHKDLVNKKISSLLEYLRTSYKVRADSDGGDYISQLTRRAGIDISETTAFFNLLEYWKGLPAISDNQLISINKKIEEFYHKLK